MFDGYAVLQLLTTSTYCNDRRAELIDELALPVDDEITRDWVAGHAVALQGLDTDGVKRCDFHGNAFPLALRDSADELLAESDVVVARVDQSGARGIDDSPWDVLISLVTNAVWLVAVVVALGIGALGLWLRRTPKRPDVDVID